MLYVLSRMNFAVFFPWTKNCLYSIAENIKVYDKTICDLVEAKESVTGNKIN